MEEASNRSLIRSISLLSLMGALEAASTDFLRHFLFFWSISLRGVAVASTAEDSDFDGFASMFDLVGSWGDWGEEESAVPRRAGWLVCAVIILEKIGCNGELPSRWLEVR